MKELTDLVNISNYFGHDKFFVIAGGGNVSYKNSTKIWVKASGISLANLTAESLAVLDRASLQVIAEKKYSENIVLREEEVKNDLFAATITKEKRPSVETSIHNLINFKYVVHLHPTFINGVTCSINSQRVIRELFGARDIFLPYTNPGYLLFKQIVSRINLYKKKFGKEPSVIWLQNHGIFVAADKVDEVKTTYHKIIEIIRGHVKNISLVEEIAESTTIFPGYEITQIFFPGKFLLLRKSELILQHAATIESFLKIAQPFTPDQVVYCKGNYLYFDGDLIAAKTLLWKAVSDFLAKNKHLPKVILVKNVGCIAVGDTESDCQIIADVFEDAIKIAAITENFGGPHAISEENIFFIENWEVENYRRMVAIKRS